MIRDDEMMIRDDEMMIRDHGMMIRDHGMMIRNYGMKTKEKKTAIIPCHYYSFWTYNYDNTLNFPVESKTGLSPR